MPRKKQLKIRGSQITNYNVVIKSVKSIHTDAMIEIISLLISTKDDSFCYQIHSDQRHLDLQLITQHIDASLNKAKSDYLNVEISEYKERHYLFFDVQKIGQSQYTGERVECN